MTDGNDPLLDVELTESIDPMLEVKLYCDSDQGGRRYMEDMVRVHFEETKPGEAQYLYLAVFDGHGGPDAAKFAKQSLFRELRAMPEFWSGNEEDMKTALRSAFWSTHLAMWKEREQWPRLPVGHESTAGTTASVAIIRERKLYLATCGDSSVVLCSKRRDGRVEGKMISRDHKPECPLERLRVKKCGGDIQQKSGVNRVVWFRQKRTPPQTMSQDRVSTRHGNTESIPFLAITRSLGDLWSYNAESDDYVVSPQPDIITVDLDPDSHFSLVVASDGLWNVMKPHTVASRLFNYQATCPDANFSELLTKLALNLWKGRSGNADNISIITTMFSKPSDLTIKNLINMKAGYSVRLMPYEAREPPAEEKRMYPLKYKHESKRKLQSTPIVEEANTDSDPTSRVSNPSILPRGISRSVPRRRPQTRSQAPRLKRHLSFDDLRVETADEMIVHLAAPAAPQEKRTRLDDLAEEAMSPAIVIEHPQPTFDFDSHPITENSIAVTDDSSTGLVAPDVLLKPRIVA